MLCVPVCVCTGRTVPEREAALSCPSTLCPPPESVLHTGLSLSAAVLFTPWINKALNIAALIAKTISCEINEDET